MNEPMADISRHVWETKYRYAHECTIADSWSRIALALAAVEPHDPAGWEARFFRILQCYKFLPGGRIQAGAGTARSVTLFNCFVMGSIEDSIHGIFKALQESAVTMQQGGGIGLDFSTLRPRGAAAKGAGTIASGPVSFMQIWEAMCGTILSTGARCGAMMATLRCDHPDIEEFIAAKQQPGQLSHFNLSIQVTDGFMAAMRSDAEWPLVYPVGVLEGDGETVSREWPGSTRAVPCGVVRRIRARQLWDRILQATYDCSEPGVLFIDRINRVNNLWYRERITATNPCGEISLPPYGACDLGSLILTCFVRSPFTPQARIDFKDLADTARLAIWLLDNVIDASRFPLLEQAENARNSRRIGLGITGLADVLVMLGLAYGSDRAISQAVDIMRCICHEALERAGAYLRRLLQSQGAPRKRNHQGFCAYRLCVSQVARERQRRERNACRFCHCLGTSGSWSHRHAGRAAALCRVSKTINVPWDCQFRDFAQIYDLAFDQGLKGCTTFRPNPITGTVLSEETAGIEGPHCCALEREAD